MMKHVLFMLLLFADTISGLKRNRNYETEVIDTILDGYNRQARPTRNLAQPINVTITMHLSKVLDLDERSEALTTYLWFDVLWTDELLQWNASDFGGIESVTLLPTQVWLPDFGITNTADRVFYEDHFRFFRVSLSNTGAIMWHPGGIYTTSCPLTVTYFPFDTQLCGFSVMNWEYDGFEQLLKAGSTAVEPDLSYRENGEWHLKDSWACTGVQTFPDGDPLGFVNFYMMMERKSRYSVINVLIPIILLSLMDLLVFWLPPESGEKVSLGITVLLSFSVFLLVVDERMPRTSDTVPILTVYLSCVMGTTGLSLFLTVFILHLNYKTHKTPVPRWLRFLLRISRRQDDSKVKVVTISDSNMNNNGTLNSFQNIVDRVNGTKENDNVHMNISKEKMNEEWKVVVKRLDQIFFLIFVVIFLLLLLIMVYPYDNEVTIDKTAKCPFGQ